MIKYDQNILLILERAEDGVAPSQNDCISLLECVPYSPEAALTRVVADAISRKRFGNEGIILGQIGIELDACPGKCKFCSFGEEHTRFEPKTMTDSEIIEHAINFTASGDLYALFLMTMHEFKFERLLESVRMIRSSMPEPPQIVVNIGDFDKIQAKELKAAGGDGAYHVCRLREGVDTALDPEERKRTIKGNKRGRAGLVLLL